MEEKIQNHEERILKLESSYENVDKKLKEVTEQQQKTHTALEKVNSTVLSESNSQKELLGRLIDHHFNLKAQELNGTNEVRKQEITGKLEVSKIRWQTVTGLLGTGGGLILALQWIYDTFLK